MSTTPGLVGRLDHQVSIMFRNSPDVTAWRIGAKGTLDGAYAGTTPIFTVERSTNYRSPSIVRKRIRFPDSPSRGITQALFDPDDFRDPANDVPGDDDLSYIRVEERNAAGVWRPAGPIWLLPTSDFFAVESPSVTVSGTAPAALLGPHGYPPAGALCIRFPRPVGTLLMRNGGGNTLKIGFSAGQDMNELAGGEQTQFFDANDYMMFLCVDHATNTTTFSAYAGLINGK